MLSFPTSCVHVPSKRPFPMEHNGISAHHVLQSGSCQGALALRPVQTSCDQLSLQACTASSTQWTGVATPLTVAVLSKGSACMTYTPQRRKSLSLYGTPFSSTRPLIDPLPAILHASAFNCSTGTHHAKLRMAEPLLRIRDRTCTSPLHSFCTRGTLL